MNQKRLNSQQLLTVLFPGLLLLVSSLYLSFTNLLLLQPYPMLCISGLLALPACLIWGGGLYTRMLQPGVRHGMGGITLLLALWSLLYLLSGIFAAEAGALQVFSALSALPPLLLPAFLLHTFISANQPPEQQKPCATVWTLLGLGIVIGIWAMIGIFVPLPLSMGTSTMAIESPIIFGFFCLGTVGAQVYLLIPARRSPTRLLPPLCLLIAELAIFVCMAPGISLLPAMLLAYGGPLLLLAFCSLCEWTGLLPNGSKLPMLLQHSTLPVQLMDLDGTILYGADLALPITAGHKSAILNNRYHVNLSLHPDIDLTAAAIRGGYALRQTDLRDLHALETKLAALQKELAAGNELLSHENELERQLREATSQNEYFARQERKIQDKTVRASLLLRCAAAQSPEPGFRRAAVTRANVLVAYVQQLGLLLQKARENSAFPVSVLTEAMASTAQAVTAAGLRCRVYSVAQGTYPADVILTLFDLQELLLEDALSQGLPTVELRLRNEQSGLRLVVSVREAQKTRFPAEPQRVHALAASLGGSIRITEDDGAVSVSMELLRGGAHHD